LQRIGGAAGVTGNTLYAPSDAGRDAQTRSAGAGSAGKAGADSACPVEHAIEEYANLRAPSVGIMDRFAHWLTGDGKSDAKKESSGAPSKLPSMAEMFTAAAFVVSRNNGVWDAATALCEAHTWRAGSDTDTEWSDEESEGGETDSDSED